MHRCARSRNRRLVSFFFFLLHKSIETSIFVPTGLCSVFFGWLSSDFLFRRLRKKTKRWERIEGGGKERGWWRKRVERNGPHDTIWDILATFRWLMYIEKLQNLWYEYACGDLVGILLVSCSFVLLFFISIFFNHLKKDHHKRTVGDWECRRRKRRQHQGKNRKLFFSYWFFRCFVA